MVLTQENAKEIKQMQENGYTIPVITRHFKDRGYKNTWGRSLSTCNVKHFIAKHVHKTQAQVFTTSEATTASTSEDVIQFIVKSKLDKTTKLKVLEQIL